jgi:hypothetical protein
LELVSLIYKVIQIYSEEKKRLTPPEPKKSSQRLPGFTGTGSVPYDDLPTHIIIKRFNPEFESKLPQLNLKQNSFGLEIFSFHKHNTLAGHNSNSAKYLVLSAAIV